MKTKPKTNRKTTMIRIDKKLKYKLKIEAAKKGITMIDLIKEKFYDKPRFKR